MLYTNKVILTLKLKRKKTTNKKKIFVKKTSFTSISSKNMIKYK